jgi:hypothetical protein
MRHTPPSPQDAINAVPGIAWPLLAMLAVAMAWMLGHAALTARADQDARRMEFVRATARIQDAIPFMRELEKKLLASTSSPRTSRYYQERRQEVRGRVDQLGRTAASLADTPQEKAHIERLATVVRVADARYQQVLVSAAALRPQATRTSEAAAVQQP